jgi:predicted alpha/beta superfamily hydrolase
MIEHIIYMLGPFEIPAVGRRHVRVYVPPHLHREGRGPGPVLYMFDGQNLFHDEPSFAGGWHLHRTAERFARQKRRTPVIVGIDHGGERRIDELGPFPTDRGGGRTDALLDWMGQALLPQIQRDFGVAREPEHVGVGGSSMGGLAALYAHFRRPELFGLVLSMSPALWFGNSRIFEFIAASGKPWRSRIYLDSGGLEAGGAMLKAAQRLAEHLRGRGWDDSSLRFLASRRGTHNEKHWRRRAPLALEFLFHPEGRKARQRKPAA